MPLKQAELTPEFQDVLSSKPSGSKLITVLGAVGALSFAGRLAGEENRLNAVNRHLLPHGYSISPNASVHVSDLGSDSDMLKGDLNNSKITLLFLSCLYYNPDDKSGALAMQQSELAFDPENWIQSFQDIAALVIVNMWFSADQASGERLSDLILKTQQYSSILQLDDFVCSEQDCFDGSYEQKVGGEIFVRSAP